MTNSECGPSSQHRLRVFGFTILTLACISCGFSAEDVQAKILASHRKDTEKLAAESAGWALSEYERASKEGDMNAAAKFRALRRKFLMDSLINSSEWERACDHLRFTFKDGVVSFPPKGLGVYYLNDEGCCICWPGGGYENLVLSSTSDNEGTMRGESMKRLVKEKDGK